MSGFINSIGPIAKLLNSFIDILRQVGILKKDGEGRVQDQNKAEDEKGPEEIGNAAEDHKALTSETDAEIERLKK